MERLCAPTKLAEDSLSFEPLCAQNGQTSVHLLNSVVVFRSCISLEPVLALGVLNKLGQIRFERKRTRFARNVFIAHRADNV